MEAVIASTAQVVGTGIADEESKGDKGHQGIPHHQAKSQKRKSLLWIIGWIWLNMVE